MWYSVRENKELKLVGWLMMVLKKPWNTEYNKLKEVDMWR